MADLVEEHSKIILDPQGLEGPEYSININNKGQWTLIETLRVALKDCIIHLKRPMRSLHPEFQWLRLDDIDGVTEPGGIMAITYRYIGQVGEGEDEEDPVLPKSGLRISVSDEPLLSHIRYEDLDEAEKLALAKIISGNTDSALEDEVTSLRGREALAKIRKGTTAYRDPKVEYTRSWTSNRPLGNLNAVGHIDVPPEAPSVADDRDWLYSGAEQDHQGATYSVTQIWELSGRGGHDPDLYS